MMSGADNSVFVDTNVLVYAAVVGSPFYAAARNALMHHEQSGSKIWVSRQVLREYLAVLTRPQSYARPSPLPALIADISLFESRFALAEDGPHVTKALLALLGQIPSGGKQIHDANIVATMQAYAIPAVLTHNVDDFARFSRVITVVPL